MPRKGKFIEIENRPLVLWSFRNCLELEVGDGGSDYKWDILGRWRSSKLDWGDGCTSLLSLLKIIASYMNNWSVL